MRYLFICLGFTVALNVYSQKADVSEFKESLLNWYNKDPMEDGILGTGVDEAYRFIQENNLKPKKTVVVAVMDSGIDIDHEDFMGQIWVNEDEIPDNGVDDDNNGYIDDIHGWNFIGNKEGEHILFENFEYTRILREGDPKSTDLDRAAEMHESELAKRLQEKQNLKRFEEYLNTAKAIIKAETGIVVDSEEDLKRVNSNEERVRQSKAFLKDRYAMGFTDDDLKQLIEQNFNYLEYYLNTDFSPRILVNDDPKDLEDKYYGNPDVKGPRANHGTSVAGVIAALRNNAMGINGIATNIQIMPIRSTPNGDERDKDVALGIMYAVDNGADIINMSFGKDFSPQKEFVDQAVRYAEEKGVLIVHGSGNSGKNIDKEESYPSDRYLDGVEATNWINVGASSIKKDRELAAIFSNYGANHVDIFAPGTDIISTDTSNTYSKHDGTSLASPIVAGIAALLLSYFPDLTPKNIIDLFISTAYIPEDPKKVLVPSLEDKKRKRTRFGKLSKSGGIVNAHAAFKEAYKKANQNIN